ncbi:MAG TPA: MerR family transcriptional regulator [Jatrophihabitans sp.]
MTARNSGPLRSAGTLTIGDVLAQLKPGFPDLTISKIRFLEDEGLVRPDRTPAGYRKFSEPDVERLRYVLTQQKEHYLPLKVIKDQLDAIDRGLVPPNGKAGGAAGPRVPNVVIAAIEDNAPTAESFRTTTAAMRLTRQELLNAAGLREEQLEELEQFGLIAAKTGGHYDDDALVVGKIVGELAQYGLEGRHLRAFKTAADREVGLFGQIVGPMSKQRGSEAKARAEETVREMAALSVRLHAALVHIGLRDVIV